MAIEQRFTDLPAVSSATLNDIICAVQGYVSPSSLGTSTQQTLQQVYNLFQSTLVLFNPGNPNGVVAGNAYQLCWDTVDAILWVCTTSGTSFTAVWQQCISSQSNYTNVTTGSVSMVANSNYICDHGASIITFTLPLTAPLGSVIKIAGKSSGGWTIAQNSGQSINLGSLQSTSGVGGSISSSNQNDFVNLLCVVGNTEWTVIASMGNLTII